MVRLPRISKAKLVMNEVRIAQVQVVIVKHDIQVLSCVPQESRLLLFPVKVYSIQDSHIS